MPPKEGSKDEDTTIVIDVKNGGELFSPLRRLGRSHCLNHGRLRSL